MMFRRKFFTNKGAVHNKGNGVILPGASESPSGVEFHGLMPFLNTWVLDGGQCFILPHVGH
jgi:hypothetical protein